MLRIELQGPFIIMFSIPLAAIGVIGMLLLTKAPFSMQAYIVVIMLTGIVVSNAILGWRGVFSNGHVHEPATATPPTPAS